MSNLSESPLGENLINPLRYRKHTATCSVAYNPVTADKMTYSYAQNYILSETDWQSIWTYIAMVRCDAKNNGLANSEIDELTELAVSRMRYLKQLSVS